MHRLITLFRAISTLTSPAKTPRPRRHLGVVVLAVTAGLIVVAPPAAKPVTAQDKFLMDDVLGMTSTRAAGLSPDGRWLLTSKASLRDRLGIDNSRYGDPAYVSPSVATYAVIDTRSGESMPLSGESLQIRGWSWSPDSSRAAFMEFDGEWWQPKVWGRDSGEIRDVAVPESMELAENTSFAWFPDSSAVVLAARPAEWRVEGHRKFVELTDGPVVVLSSDDEFLAWEAMRRLPLERSLYAYDLESGAIRDLGVDGLVRSYRVAENGEFVIVDKDITDETDYERIFGSQSSIHYVPLGPGEPYAILDSTQGRRLIWSGDSTHYAYTDEGKIFLSSVDGQPTEIEPVIDPEEIPVREESDDPDDEAAEDEERRDRFSITRVSHSGDAMILSNRYGLWLMDTATAEADLLLDIDGDDDKAPRYSVAAWSQDGQTMLFSYASRTEWQRGLYRYDVADGSMTELVMDDRSYSGINLSDDGSTLVLSISEANRPAELFVTDTGFALPRQLTDDNSQVVGKGLTDPQLIEYLDVDGNEMYGILYPPVGWSEGDAPVPTLFAVYETFFDPRFSSTTNLFNAHGYAVVQPSVTLETGYPGEAWVKGVTAAANKLIDMGIADADKLGVYGTSYGGYATNLLIAQTDRFKAAINISGKVNMVSFYTDSPRLGVRNIHAPENSQDRIGATLWEQPQKYIAHSAIMFADRIKTPLLLMTGEQDYNVPARQAMEMYYALRRLGRRVEWVNYMNGGHGMPRYTEDDVIDYHRRMIDWFDTYLKGDEETETTDSGTLR